MTSLRHILHLAQIAMDKAQTGHVRCSDKASRDIALAHPDPISL